MAYLDSAGLSRLLFGLKNVLVLNTRKINNQALSSDITLSASDIGAIPLDQTKNSVRIIQSKPSFYREGTVAGAVKIAFPVGSDPYLGTLARLRVIGLDSLQPCAWQLDVSGLPLTGSWRNCSAVSPAGNMRYDKVRFWADATRCGILIGDITDSHDNPMVVLDAIEGVYAPENLSADGWEISLITSETGLTFSGGTFYANTPMPSIERLNWIPGTLINGATGSLRYCKYGSWVIVQGYPVKRNSTSNSMAIFNLPVGYRPLNPYAIDICWGFLTTPVATLVSNSGMIYLSQNGVGSLEAATDYHFYICFLAEA